MSESIRQVITLGFLLSLYACNRPMHELRPGGAGFRILLPGTYVCGPWQDGIGPHSLKGHSCTVQLIASTPTLRRPSAQVSVSWASVSPSLDIDNLAESLRESYKGLVPATERIAERTADLGEATGREFEAVVLATEAPAAAITIRARYVIHDGRLYELRMSGVFDRNVERLWDEVLASFRFVH